MRPILLVVMAVFRSVTYAQNTFAYLNSGKPLLDAHNCYPEDGRWSDRLDRALSVGGRIAIEQDLAWVPDTANQKGKVVVSHRAKPTGLEPSLESYFFAKVRPLMEEALRKNDRKQWPLIVLHFDFKSNDAPLLHAVWDLLGKYDAWITTATKAAHDDQLQPFDAKPLLVLTEDSDAQEEVFFHQVPVGARLRLFGSAHTGHVPGTSEVERAHNAVSMAPEDLLTERPSNYRRWWNNSWYEVEEGGQRHAGEWASADGVRLRALVDHAHRLGFWIRFYTLDGIPTGQGWTAGYNFGSRAEVLKRWEAAIDAGVDLIATDQYEDLAAVMKR